MSTGRWRDTVLTILWQSDRGGFTTGDIAQQAAREIPYLQAVTRAQGSAAMFATLIAMEGAGLVRRMDTLKPIVWVAAAPEALPAAAAGSQAQPNNQEAAAQTIAQQNGKGTA